MILHIFFRAADGIILKTGLWSRYFSVSNLYVLISYRLTIRLIMRWHIILYIILYALRYKTESRGSIPDGVIRIFHWLTPSSRTQQRSQWPRGLRRGSVAGRWLEAWVRIPLVSWMFVCCECYVLSGRGLCVELITRPEESYRLCYFVVHDLETS